MLKKGSVALPARILFEIIRELPEADVSFEAVGTRVEMKIPNGSYKIAAISPDDFPKLPAVNTKKEIRIEALISFEWCGRPLSPARAMRLVRH